MYNFANQLISGYRAQIRTALPIFEPQSPTPRPKSKNSQHQTHYFFFINSDRLTSCFICFAPGCPMICAVATKWRSLLWMSSTAILS